MKFVKMNMSLEKPIRAQRLFDCGIESITTDQAEWMSKQLGRIKS